MIKNIGLALLALFAMVCGADAAVPSCTGALNTQYFIASDTNPGTQVYDPNRGFVNNTDASFKTWLGGVNPCLAVTISAVGNNGSGLARLTVPNTAAFTNNQWWEVFGTVTYDQAWQITVVDSQHIDLQLSNFTVTATGGIYGPQIVATAAGLYANVNSYNATLPVVPGTALNVVGTTTLTNPLPAWIEITLCSSSPQINMPPANVVTAPTLNRPTTFHMSGCSLPINVQTNNGVINIAKLKPSDRTDVILLGNTSVNGLWGTASPLPTDAFSSFSAIPNLLPTPQVNGQGAVSWQPAALSQVSSFQNMLRNSSLTAWFHGCFTGVCTITTAGGWCAEGVWVVPTGASVTCGAINSPAALPNGPYAMQITGAASVTDVKVRFVLESIDAARFANQFWAFQIPITNNVGSTITPTLQTAFPTTVDGGVTGGGGWSATTVDVSAVNLQSCTNGSTCTLARKGHQASASAQNGYEFVVDFGAIINGQSVTIGAGFDARVLNQATTGGPVQDTNPLPPEVKTAQVDIAWCQRFFASNFPNAGAAPANASQTIYHFGGAVTTTTIDGQFIQFPVQMRASPTMTYYSPSAGTPSNGLWEFFNGANTNSTATGSLVITRVGFAPTLTSTGLTAFQGLLIFGSWTADASISGGYLLKRDLDPAANDNSPAFLDAAA